MQTEVSDPKPIYLRGMHFSESYMTLETFVLNTTFALRFWIRNSSGGTLYSVNRSSYEKEYDEEFVKIFIEANGAVNVLYAHGDETKFTYTTTGSVGNDWMLLTVSISYNVGVSVFLNRDLDVGEQPLNQSIIDNPVYLHLLGAEMTTVDNAPMVTGYFSGMIYEFCLHNVSISDPSLYILEPSECGPGYCTFCPTDPDTCLISCNWNQRLEDGTCFD